MAKIKEITIRTIFQATYFDMEVSDSVERGLDKIYDRAGISDDVVDMISDSDIKDAYDWLRENVVLADATNLEYEIY